ncbi:MAG: hypothetical protein J6C82_05410 [Clostridia bacterium]|nr:hypothetical protein [Clostridia bacterium]
MDKNPFKLPITILTLVFNVLFVLTHPEVITDENNNDDDYSNWDNEEDYDWDDEYDDKDY